MIPGIASESSALGALGRLFGEDYSAFGLELEEVEGRVWEEHGGFRRWGLGRELWWGRSNGSWFRRGTMFGEIYDGFFAERQWDNDILKRKREGDKNIKKMHIESNILRLGAGHAKKIIFHFSD